MALDLVHSPLLSYTSYCASDDRVDRSRESIDFSFEHIQLLNGSVLMREQSMSSPETDTL